MFRTTNSPILRSTFWLYIQLLVQCTDIAAGRQQYRCNILRLNFCYIHFYVILDAPWYNLAFCLHRLPDSVSVVFKLRLFLKWYKTKIANISRFTLPPVSRNNSTVSSGYELWSPMEKLQIILKWQPSRYLETFDVCLTCIIDINKVDDQLYAKITLYW